MFSIKDKSFFAYQDRIDDFDEYNDLNEVPRFSGIAELFRHAYENDYMENYEMFNVDNPPTNPDLYLKYRNELIHRCNEFIGEDSVYNNSQFRLSVFDKINKKNIVFNKEIVMKNFIDSHMQFFSVNKEREKEKIQNIFTNYWLDSLQEGTCMDKYLLPSASCKICLIEKYKILVEKLKKFCAKYENIYIYGAGIIAVEIAEIMKMEKCRFNSFVVSDIKNNKTKLLGYKVIEFQGIDLKKQEVGIILALSEINFNQVLCKIKRMGYNDYFNAGKYSYKY